MVLGLNERLKTAGYAVVENLLREEHLSEVSHVTEQLIRRWQANEFNSEDFRTYKLSEAPMPILYRIHNLEKKHHCIEQLVKSRPLMDTVQGLMGTEAVPTAFALIIKMPYYGGKVPYHRDPVAVPHGTIYNFSVFLDDSGPENGCFEAVPGSHLLLGETEMFDERPEGAVFVSARRGDVLVHDVRVIHGSE